jgi:hypothetical protein
VRASSLAASAPVQVPLLSRSRLPGTSRRGYVEARHVEGKARRGRGPHVKGEAVRGARLRRRRGTSDQPRRRLAISISMAAAPIDVHSGSAQLSTGWLLAVGPEFPNPNQRDEWTGTA